jgi:hypothetical protein
MMSIESLTYADLAGRLGTSREAARSLVRRLRLPRRTGNDGTVRVNVDLAEIQYRSQPQRSHCGHRADFEALEAQIEQLQAEVTARPSQFWMTLRTRRRAVSSQQFRPNAPPRPEEPIMQLDSIPAGVRTFADDRPADAR